MAQRPMESLSAAQQQFERAFPAYRLTHAVDALRAREFTRLAAGGHVYLDYTGAALYPESQVRRHARMLEHLVLGNPHSHSPASEAATALVEKTRARVLAFFDGSPDEYHVVFTANASHALKLVGESYAFGPGGTFVLTFDNHNSVNGIREFARAKGARTVYVPVLPPEMRTPDAAIGGALTERAGAGGGHLFAYPAQSNFSGVQHPLEWIDLAHERGWDVLLDAAAFAPTNRLSLARWKPDFVALSFYKMFGYPTGIGALIARHEALHALHRPWFAGGTITVASVSADRFVPAPGAAAFEDGTVDYANLPAVDIGLDLLEAVGRDVIHERVRCLTGWLLDELAALRHANGRPLLTIYGPTTTERRGGTIAMNFHDRGGQVIDHAIIETRASARGISLRTGCFCNPGAGELALGLSGDDLQPCFGRADHPMTYESFRHCVAPKSSGAVRVSLGLASNFADAYAFVGFAEELLE
jgi:selenocysteine lyase/cysteine desulfurase